MSSSNMCVFALCLVLIAVAESHIIKTKDFEIPPEGMTLEVTLNNKSDRAHPISVMKIDVDGLHKKVTVSASDSTKMPKKLTPDPDFVPKFETRHGIRVGTCPTGFVRKGGFCFPDDDY